MPIGYWPPQPSWPGAIPHPEIGRPIPYVKTCIATIRDELPVALGWLALALFCGLRPEEAEKLQCSDIDVEKGIVKVDAAA